MMGKDQINHVVQFLNAFDEVPHQKLLKGVSCDGMQRQASQIKNWSKYRKQVVGINGQLP